MNFSSDFFELNYLIKCIFKINKLKIIDEAGRRI